MLYQGLIYVWLQILARSFEHEWSQMIECFSLCKMKQDQFKIRVGFKRNLTELAGALFAQVNDFCWRKDCDSLVEPSSM
jgi:hypothetical protein